MDWYGYRSYPSRNQKENGKIEDSEKVADVTIPIAALVNQGQLVIPSQVIKVGSGTFFGPSKLHAYRQYSPKFLDFTTLLHCFQKHSECGISSQEGSTESKLEIVKELFVL